MKRSLIYIAGILLVLLVLALVWSDRRKNAHVFNSRITLNRKDKIPYGCFVAYENLKYAFPGAKLNVNRLAPGNWDDSTLTADTNHQVLMVISRNFNAENQELTDLFHFVSKGNDVFISAVDFSRDAEDFFHFTASDNYFTYYVPEGSTLDDTLRLSLMKPPYSDSSNSFSYPGRKLNVHFATFDTGMCYILGRTMDSMPLYVDGRHIDSLPMFLRFRAGQGNFYIHTAPLAFSNYFLLHDRNMAYYNQLMSALDPEARKIVWDEYYLYKPKYEGKETSPWRVLMEQSAFKWAIYLAILGLLIFVLLSVKRRQRYVPEKIPPRNDSLDFVKTVGRLYFQKKDNKNLCMKMISYFTEHIHNRYKMHTGNMDQEFESKLVQKSGCDDKTVHLILDYVRDIPDAPAISDQQTVEFYQLLNKFYKTT